MQDLLIDLDVHLSSSDEELDTIVQGYDGNDYIIVLKNGCKIWDLYNTNNEDEELFCMPNVTIRSDKKPVKMKKTAGKIDVPQQTVTSEPVKRGRGRPKKNPDHEPRKPRQPTAYNLFLKAKLAELSITYPHLPNKERMKIASNIWNETKI